MLHQLNISVHVIAGLIAIFLGIIAYATAKGGRNHQRSGRLFLVFMAVVVLTAANGVLHFVDRPFLSVVTLQAAYLTWSGWRAVKRKSRPLRRYDLLITLAVTFFVADFFVKLQTANVVWNKAVVGYILGYLLLILLFDLARHARPALVRGASFWVYDHVFRMTGAFTALASAGIGTVLGDWAPWSQIIPAGWATVWLVFALWYFPRRYLADKRNHLRIGQTETE